jgi:hypothetical protein
MHTHSENRQIPLVEDQNKFPLQLTEYNYYLPDLNLVGHKDPAC